MFSYDVRHLITVQKYDSFKYIVRPRETILRNMCAQQLEGVYNLQQHTLSNCIS